MKRLLQLFLLLAVALQASSKITVVVVEMGGLQYHLRYNDMEDKATAWVERSPTVTGDIVIPDSVTHDGRRYAVTDIAMNAFRDCTGITSITLPATLQAISSRAFEGCTGLTTIILPPRLKQIGNFAFSGCTGLIEIVVPDKVKRLGMAAFMGCTGLTKVALPATLKEIPQSLFEDCTGLTEVPIPAAVREIKAGAYAKCTGLTEVTIPGEVKSIGAYAFIGCDNLASVYVENLISKYGIDVNKVGMVRNGGKKMFPPNVTIYLDPDCLEAYRKNLYWGEYNLCPWQE